MCLPPIFAPVPAALRSIILRNTLTPFTVLNAVLVGMLVAVHAATGDDRLRWDSLGIVLVMTVNTAVAIRREWRAHGTLEGIVLASGMRAMPRVMDGITTITRGTVVPCDGVVIEAEGCEVDTALLTGESRPLTIAPGDMIYAGTVCVAGTATIRATAEGGDTVASGIEALARQVDLRPSPLQRKVNTIFTWCFGIAIAIAAVELVLHPIVLADDVDRIRRIAAVVLGLIPEGLVLFATITMTLGALRVSRLGVIVQRISALETFAEVGVICFDKTGTLTENRLDVDEIVPQSSIDRAACASLLSAYGYASNDAGPVIDALRRLTPVGDPLSVHSRVPFSSTRAYSAIETVDGTHYRLEAMDAEQGLGLRLVVNGEVTCTVVLRDALRSDAADTLRQFRAMGVRTYMVTGDGEPYTRRVAANLGNDLITGIMARCTPASKRTTVEHFRATDVVAMVGDGVNDLPAIKEAHVGIAVADAAPAVKLGADVVLNGASFSVFPAMIDEGRAAIRTVLGVAKVFLAKNVALVAVNVLAATGMIGPTFTPRNGALLTLLAVSAPAMFLAATASVRIRTRSFVHELVLWTLPAGATAAAAAVTTPTAPVLSVLTTLLTWTVVVDVLPTRLRIQAAIVAASSLALVVGASTLAGAWWPINAIVRFFELDLLPDLPSQSLAIAVGLTWGIFGILVHTLVHRLIPSEQRP